MEIGYRYIKAIFFGYVLVIVTGAILLKLPISHLGALSFVDALFTSASATSVTGLIVTSTSENFTFLGQAVILLLIQIGGIGYMTLVTIFFLYLKSSLNIDDKWMMKHSLDLPNLNVASFVKKIFLLVVVIEIVGAAVLTEVFLEKYGWGDALWYGIFHSVSAFNNAGFSLFTDSFIGYDHSALVLFTLSLLIIIGGLGYVVLIELYENRKFKRIYSLHTKIMLYGTLFLIVFAMLLFLSIEWNNPLTFGTMSTYEKILNGYFLSVNFRTSGFNSVDIGALKESSLFFSTLFMMIGGGQGSTAGGVKVTTVAILIVAVIYTLRGNNQEPNIFKRTIDQKTINKAIAMLMISSALVLAATLLLVETQNLPFTKILFEVVSAFGTVGVSAGNGGILSFSQQFNDLGKGVIIILMLAGRVGVFAFGVFLVGKSKNRYFTYPKGKILI